MTIWTTKWPTKLGPQMDHRLWHTFGGPSGVPKLVVPIWWDIFWTILCAKVAGPVELTTNSGPPNGPLNLAEQWPADFMTRGPMKWVTNWTNN